MTRTEAVTGLGEPFLDLSQESHGNSLGVGLANAITKRFFDKIDLEMMYPNSLHIGNIMLSEAYYADVLAGKYPGLEAVSAPEALEFDAEGALLTPIVEA